MFSRESLSLLDCSYNLGLSRSPLSQPPSGVRMQTDFHLLRYSARQSLIARSIKSVSTGLIPAPQK